MAIVKKTSLVPFGQLRFGGNVRGQKCLQLDSMKASLQRNGFKHNHPLVVSEKVDDETGEITYLVLVGNRRGLSLAQILEADSAEFDRILPGGKVSALIHKGLTIEEEIALRIDHNPDEDRVPLDDYSQYLAVKQLLQCFAGDSQEKIAEKLGIYKFDKKEGKNVPNRAWVQPRVNLARLPSEVEEEYRKYWEDGKDATTVRVGDIAKLYKAFNADYNPEQPEGSDAYRELWSKVLNPEPTASDDSDSDDTTKSLKPAAARELSQVAASRFVKRVLYAITGQGGDLSEIDTEALEAETAVQILADVRAYMGDNDFNHMIGEAQNARLERERQEKESQEVEAVVS